jgi:hypothetical protein
MPDTAATIRPRAEAGTRRPAKPYRVGDPTEMPTPSEEQPGEGDGGIGGRGQQQRARRGDDARGDEKGDVAVRPAEECPDSRTAGQPDSRRRAGEDRRSEARHGRRGSARLRGRPRSTAALIAGTAAAYIPKVTPKPANAASTTASARRAPAGVSASSRTRGAVLSGSWPVTRAPPSPYGRTAAWRRGEWFVIPQALGDRQPEPSRTLFWVATLACPYKALMTNARASRSSSSVGTGPVSDGRRGGPRCRSCGASGRRTVRRRSAWPRRRCPSGRCRTPTPGRRYRPR